jgi:hypothetical protein
MNNINIDDIKQIEIELGIQLNENQREVVLAEYQRLVMDRADDWSVILKNLIMSIC